MKLIIAMPNNIQPKPMFCTSVPLRAGPRIRRQVEGSNIREPTGDRPRDYLAYQ